MHRKAEEEADTAVVSATHPGSPRTRGASCPPDARCQPVRPRSVFVGWWTTQRGAAWAPRRRGRPLRHGTESAVFLYPPEPVPMDRLTGSAQPWAVEIGDGGDWGRW